LDSRLVAMMRLVLSSSVLFIIAPADLEDIGAFHILTALCTTYSGLLYLFAGRQIQMIFTKLSYWTDISWAALLVMVGDDSITAFLFLFPVLVASFQVVFGAALHLTLVAAILLVTLGSFKELEDYRHITDLPLPEMLLP